MRAAFMLLWTVVLMPLQIVAVALNLGVRHRLPQRWHRGILRIAGINLDIDGTLSPYKPTLFVSNHCSYLDIVILGAVLPASFVSKKEIATWPLFGFLAKLQDTIFIERDPKLATLHCTEISGRLKKKQSLIIFPEGTSTNGNLVLPFKSTLFQVVQSQVQEGAGLAVQPVSMAYAKLDGMPMSRGYRHFFTWYGEMGLLTHLWQMLALGRLTVKIVLHPVIDGAQTHNRKDLALTCENAVREGVMRGLYQQSSKQKAA